MAVASAVASGGIAKSRTVGSAALLVSGDHVFEIPAKLIKNPSDMRIWEKSEAYYEYLGFILAINEAIRGKSNSQGSQDLSESVSSLIGVLDKLDALIDETPPVEQPQRFGNVAFRTWFSKMRDGSLTLIQEVFESTFNQAIPEIVTYLIDSFGNSTRIDYGTGHEISFIMFLCCLFKIGVLGDYDKVATGCCVFPRYLDLARKLQKTYRMEPAGSHGVWSLDDYQFVPFIWGSSQLFGHIVVEPHMFLQPQVLNEFGEDYMFLTCIKYINSVKTGPFAEHSNQLWSISGVSSWQKINGGLIKMYKAEVLSKFPVVQHMVFGSLFTLKPVEECTGMMTPKYTMGPPPGISAASSFTSSRESSKSTLGSRDTKSSAGSAYSPPHSVATHDSRSLRDSMKASQGGSRATDGSGVDEGGSLYERQSNMSGVSAESGASERGARYGRQAPQIPAALLSGLARRGNAPPRGSEDSVDEMRPRAASSAQSGEGAESVRFSTEVEDEAQPHGRKRNMPDRQAYN